MSGLLKVAKRSLIFRKHEVRVKRIGEVLGPYARAIQMTLPLLTYDPPPPPPNIFILKTMQDNQLPAGQTDSNDPAVSITIICFILFAIVHTGNHRNIRSRPDTSIIEKCFKQILKN